jgi:hypothetical protein
MTKDDPEEARRLIRELLRKPGHKLSAPEVVALGRRPLIWARPDEPQPPRKRGPAPKKTMQQAGAEGRKKAITKYGSRPLRAAAKRAEQADATTKLIALAVQKIGSTGVSDIGKWLEENRKPLLDRTTIEDHVVKLGLRQRRPKTPRF